MKPKTFLAAAAVALAASAGLAQPAGAAMPLAPPAEAGSDVVQVHDGIYWRYDRPYWNGYPGYPYRRPGYKYYGGYWFPPSAFNFGIIIRPAPSPTYQLTEQHYRWCERRYRSYRRWDNTYQPYHGPREQCVSPYMYRIR